MSRFGTYQIVGAERTSLRRVIVGQVFLHGQIIVMIERGVYDIFALAPSIVLRCHAVDSECGHMALARYCPCLDDSWGERTSTDQFRWLSGAGTSVPRVERVAPRLPLGYRLG